MEGPFGSPSVSALGSRGTHGGKEKPTVGLDQCPQGPRWRVSFDGRFGQFQAEISQFFRDTAGFPACIFGRVVFNHRVRQRGRTCFNPEKPTGRVNNYGESRSPSEEGTVEVGSHQ